MGCYPYQKVTRNFSKIVLDESSLKEMRIILEMVDKNIKIFKLKPLDIENPF